MKSKMFYLIASFAILSSLLIGCSELPVSALDTETAAVISSEVTEATRAEYFDEIAQVDTTNGTSLEAVVEDLGTVPLDVSSISIPEYDNEPYVIINDNIPIVDININDYECDNTYISFESYSEWDNLGRCGVARALLGTDLMPTEERCAIGHIKPSGWHTVKYDVVEDNYLYNRCHLIAFMLAGENDNEKNLITGTRYFNVHGMLPFEEKVCDYIKDTGNHVYYVVDPIYSQNNLVADGVIMSAYSVEDNGAGLSFCVFVYNVQPGIFIDYSDGSSYQIEVIPSPAEEVQTYSISDEEFILNTNTMKFHLPSCESVSDISDHNKESFNGDRQWLIDNGYSPCKRCNP